MSKLKYAKYLNFGIYLKIIYNVEKMHDIIARNIYPNQNKQNTAASEYFYKLFRQKSARRYSAKYISKLNIFGPFLEIQILFYISSKRDYISY
jgi:hypothetical protein